MVRFGVWARASQANCCSDTVSSPLNPLQPHKTKIENTHNGDTKNAIRVMVGSSQLLTVARIMHKFSTAAPKSLALTVRPTRARVPPTRKRVPLSLLSVPYSTLAGASVTRGATHSGRRFRRFMTRTYA